MFRSLTVFVLFLLFATNNVHAGKLPCRTGCRSPRRVTHVWVPKPGELKREMPTKAPCATPCTQQVKTTTVWQAVPTVVNVNHVQTVMTTQWQWQQQTRTVLQPVSRIAVTPVTVPVQSFETHTAVRQVVKSVPVQVQRRIIAPCMQHFPGCVTTIENRSYVVNQPVSYQVPVTRYATQYVQRQVVDYRPVQQMVNVPVAVQVPVQQVQSVPTVQYRYVATQVPVNR